MIQSTINSNSYSIEFQSDGINGTVNGNEFAWDLLPISANRFNILFKNKSFNVIIESRDIDTNTLSFGLTERSFISIPKIK